MVQSGSQARVDRVMTVSRSVRPLSGGNLRWRNCPRDDTIWDALAGNAQTDALCWTWRHDDEANMTVPQGDLAHDVASTAEPFDNPDAHIPGDRRTLSPGEADPDRVRGAALFADISGFTPLTEALGERTRRASRGRGADDKSQPRVSRAHSELDSFGGQVIYFSGDAITCWLDGDDGARATACALAMQETMARLGEVVTPAGTRVQLAMKAAVAVGAARRFVVGDPDMQLIDVLAGRLIDALATAEHHGEQGRGDARSVGARGAGRSRRDRRNARRGRRAGRNRRGQRLTVAVEDAPAPVLDTLPDAVVREWVLPALYERMRDGHGRIPRRAAPGLPAVRPFRRHRLRPRRRRDPEARCVRPFTCSGS